MNIESMNRCEIVNLTYEYDANESHGIFYDKERKRIDLSLIWINNAPANDLKGWSSTFLLKEHKVKKKEGGYYLKVKEGLTLTRQLIENHPHVQKIENIKFKIKVSKPKVDFLDVDISPCCKITGLKKYLHRKHKKELTDLEGQYYYKSLPLQEEFTLDEYGIENGDVLELMTETDLLNEQVSPQEKAIPSYSSIDNFNLFVKKIKKRINIVCQIFIGDSSIGTGFMIGGYSIMTNFHVIENYMNVNENQIKKEIYAKFFYDRNDQKPNELHQKPIVVALNKNIVCWSGSIKNEFVTSHNLDYAILSLEPPKDLNELVVLKDVNITGEKFFKNALDHFSITKKDKENERMRRLRANIIEHPQNSIGEKDPLKQIAFRDNSTYDNHGSEIHYKTKTGNSASGSPVINDEGDWIGLHYAKCIRIEYELFMLKKELCEELGYTLDEELSKEEKNKSFLCYKKGEEVLYILKQRTRRNVCSNDINNKEGWFSLKKLIKKNEKVTSKQYTLEAFIFSFLTRRKLRDFTNDHAGCGTAVEVTAIFKDLNKILDEKNETKLKIKEKIGKITEEVWEKEKNRLEQEEKNSYPSWSRKRKVVVGILIAGITTTFFFACIWGSKIQKEAKKLK